MTKQEWLDFNDLDKMLKKVTSNRKKRLFALACCRSIEHLMKDQRSKDCLEKIELFIDGKINKEELQLARQAAWAAVYAASEYATWSAAKAADAATESPVYIAADAARAADAAFNAVTYTVARVDYGDYHERLKQIELLRDIYNPYLLNLKFSKQAISLAQQVYNGDDLARGVLSDYLEEQGYPDEIVVHLKSGFHPKGCWLIDQILEKK